MGYYTYYELQVIGDEEKVEQVKNFKPNEDGEFSSAYCVSSILDDCAEHYMKWYDWEHDMRLLAKMFPDVLFILSGDGEETDDVWEFRIKGDVSEQHGLCIPPFAKPELLTEKEKANNNN